MPDYSFEGETAVEDLIGSAPEGFASATALNDIMANVTDEYVNVQWSDIEARLTDLQGDFTTGPGAQVLAETSDAVGDAVNNGIVPSTEAYRFFSWLLYTAGVLLIPTAGTYAFVSGYVTKWAQGNGWATLVGPPAPTPAVQALIQSLEVPPPGVTTAPGPGTAPTPTSEPSPVPLPVVPLAPVPLSKPTLGQQTIAAGSQGLTGGTVPAGGPGDVSAAQVSAALGAMANQLVELQANVLDDMLPGMAPGQVPEALRQMNTAISAIEHQLSMVRNGIWPRGFVGLQQAFNGAAQALNGIAQEVNILHDQMAEKADSSLEDSITEMGLAVGTLTGAVGTITGTTIPAIDSAVSTVTSRVGAVESDLSTNVEPRLSTVEGEATQAAAKLALTTDECLAQLCADQANVTNPIKDGGATPSLLKQLGNILGRAFEIGAAATILDTLLTILVAPATLSAVVKDTATIEGWAVSAARVVEADLEWGASWQLAQAIGAQS